MQSVSELTLPGTLLVLGTIDDSVLEAEAV